MSRAKKYDLPKGWVDIGSDVNWEDYGGLWAWQDPDGGWWALRFTNMEDAMGRDHNPEQLYECSVLYADLDEVKDSPALKSCLDSCGWKETEEGLVTERGDLIATGSKEITYAKLNALFGGGAYATLATFYGKENPEKVRWLGVEEANRLAYSMYDLEAALEKPQNKIGTTGYEMMRGDITSAIVRGVGRNPDADLLARMYHNCDYQTVGGMLPIEDALKIEEALVNAKEK